MLVVDNNWPDLSRHLSRISANLTLKSLVPYVFTRPGTIAEGLASSQKAWLHVEVKKKKKKNQSARIV